MFCNFLIAAMSQIDLPNLIMSARSNNNKRAAKKGQSKAQIKKSRPSKPTSGSTDSRRNAAAQSMEWLQVLCVPDRNGRLDQAWLEKLQGSLPGARFINGDDQSTKESSAATAEFLRAARASDAINELNAKLEPDSGLLVIRSGLTWPWNFAQRLAALLGRTDLTDAIVLPGNYHPELNPFCGLEVGHPDIDPHSLLAAAGNGLTLPCRMPKGAMLLILPRNNRSENERTEGESRHELRCGLIDDLYLQDSTSPLDVGGMERPQMQAAFGRLRQRLSGLLSAGISAVPEFCSDGLPLTLHITHSWGGGVDRWITDQCQGDKESRHLILRAAGRKDGREHGQYLALHSGQHSEQAFADWTLAPPIADTNVNHIGYAELLQQIIQRFGVGRIVISSLIGHSLDAFRTGLPTLCVLHDFYPASPLLHQDPLNSLDAAGQFDIDAALARSTSKLIFENEDAAHWQSLAQAWKKVVEDQQVRLVAPTAHVADRWQVLFDHKLSDIRVVPHGFDRLKPWPQRLTIKHASDSPLRLVVVGRISEGKGLGLLDSALKGLNEQARITLLGAGREADRLFGRSGVDIVLNYQAERLPSLLTTLRPDAVLFLSTVPETWNYVLSEIRALALTPIATRLGSFEERIEDGVNGVLFDPNPDDLVKTVTEWADRRNELRKLGRQVPKEPSVAQAAARYRSGLAEADRRADWSPIIEQSFVRLGQTSEALLRASKKANRLNQQLEQKQIDLEERTEWAQRMQRLLHGRTDWAKHLERLVERNAAEVKRLQLLVDERTSWAQSLQKLAEQRAEEVQRLQGLADERTSWAQDLQTHADDRAAVIKQLQDLVDERTTWAQNLEDLADGRALEIERLQDLVDERTAWAQSLQGLVDERTAWAQRLQTLADDRAAEARRLQSLIDERTAWAESLEVQINHEREVFEKSRRSQAQSIDRLKLALQLTRTDLVARDHRLGELNAVMEERQQQLSDQLQHINLMSSSLSWRLTRPLRFASRLTRKCIEVQLWNPLKWPSIAKSGAKVLKADGAKGILRALYTAPKVEEVSTDVQEHAFDQAHSEQQPVTIKSAQAPTFSIIIPVFNKLEFTSACLESIAEYGAETSFEIIVVDDCSSDGTQDYLSECTGIRAFRNEQNSGFIDSCNRGASEACGEFLLFLNNDTTVTPGWLDALLTPFENDPNAGIVGARLVYPDGRLQEAGGIIFSDASGWNYGRGEDPQQPQYGFLSEADYVSGACLAIRRQDFDTLGGFDTRYRPAYYEDTDLCFQVRAMGKKVLVQPACTVIHHEGATSGTDESSGAKRYQVVNRERFSEKWRSVLDQHPDSNPNFDRSDPIRHIRYRRFSRRALVIDATTPQPDHDSGSVRIRAVMELLLARGYQVTFMAENRIYVDGYTDQLTQVGIEVLHAPSVAQFDPWLAEYGQDLDLVFVCRHYVLAPMLPQLTHYASQALLVFDTVDLHYLRELREAKLLGDSDLAAQAAETREQELSLIAQADLTLVVSPIEQALLERENPDADIRVLSNIHHVHGRGADWSERSGLLFVGGFQHVPNVDAVHWLASEIFPRVRAALPDVELHLIGSRMPDDVLALERHEGIVVHGFVEDLDPHLASARISLAPLRYGAGVKGKVNQAMSHGLPVVATRCAAEGMYLVHEQDVLVADEADQFADEVIRLYQDQALWNRLSEGGLANVETHFSRRAADSVLAKLQPGL